MRHVLPPALAALALVACSSDHGFRTREVSADDYGSAWPLTVRTAVLACEPGDRATLTVAGRTYGLDAVDRTGHPAAGLGRIWARDPQRDRGRRDLAPLVDDARSLCD